VDTVKAVQPYGWLRNAPFDLTLILGVAALALLGGSVVLMEPRLFWPVLLLDLWFLGYHHVVSTYTRLFFDAESFKTYLSVTVVAPFVIVAGVAAVVLTLGTWAVMTTYLYWQWFHYTRQSYGIARIYQVKSPGARQKDRLAEYTLYLLPLWGILSRSHQNPSTFFGQELRWLPVPLPVLEIVATLSVVTLVWWGVREARAWRSGKSRLAYVAYVASHTLIFAVGYVAIENLEFGWLVLNIWHNGQYILIVWMYNNNRFKKGLDPNHRFLSKISQTKNVFQYFFICLIISSLLYLTLGGVGVLFGSTFPLFIIAYQTLNFHHYVADGVIWKLRRKPVRTTLGLAV
jgi:hypothetical protein